MGRFIWGIIILGIGFLIIWKTDWIVNNFGRSPWAEAKLGSSGGTKLVYKLIGIAIMFFAMLMITDLQDGFLMATIGKLFRVEK